MPSPTIIFPGGWPATNKRLVPTQVIWKIPNIIGFNASPFTFQTQSYDWGHAIIRAKVQMQRMKESDARLMMGFLAGCRGRLGTFLFGDYKAVASGPQGTGGSGSVSASNQTGNILVTTLSSAQVLSGEWIGIGNRMYMVTANSGGTLNISPNLRESPNAGDPIATSNVRGLFRLTANETEFVQNNPLYQFEFDIEEAI